MLRTLNSLITGVVLPAFVISTFMLSPAITLLGRDTLTFEVLLLVSSLVIVPLSFASAAMLTLRPLLLSCASFASALACSV